MSFYQKGMEIFEMVERIKINSRRQSNAAKYWLFYDGRCHENPYENHRGRRGDLYDIRMKNVAICQGYLSFL